MFLIYVLIGASLLWWAYWMAYVVIKTRGKITILEMAAISFLIAATVTETFSLPKLTPNWRKEWEGDC